MLRNMLFVQLGGSRALHPESPLLCYRTHPALPRRLADGGPTLRGDLIANLRVLQIAWQPDLSRPI